MPDPRAIACAAIVVACQAGVALWIAPRSCDGGLELYAVAGIGAVIVMASLPFVMPGGASAAGRFAWSFAFVVAGVAAWTGELFVPGVRLLCRLF